MGQQLFAGNWQKWRKYGSAKIPANVNGNTKIPVNENGTVKTYANKDGAVKIIVLMAVHPKGIL